MSQPIYFLLFVVLLPVAAASANAESALDSSQPAVAAPGATTIEGNRMEIYLDRTMRAIGDAEMVQDGQTIYGDRIDYDVLKQELRVQGNARVVQKDTVVTGPELRMQLEARRGEMKEPVFTMRNVPIAAILPGANLPSAIPAAAAFSAGMPTSARGSAERVTFDGPERETLYGARYTTCDAGVDDWYLRAGELELDHYAQTGTAQHASVEFKGVPILYTPWISFPFNNLRKSGFLAPSWGQTTRSGFEAALPYYWNISPNMDATITPRYMSKRGTQLQSEFRYLTEDYSGEDNIEYLPSDAEENGDNRYYYKLAHRHNFGSGWSGRLNYERVSDNDYFSDMTTSIISTSRINLPQEGQLSYVDDIWNFSAFMQQFQTLEDGFYQYERKPQLTLTGNKEWELGRGNLYAEWVRYDRDDKDPNKNSFATGNRLTTYPGISVPYGRSYGYLTPKFGIHHTRYNLDSNDALGIEESTSRTLPIFSLDSGLFFDRDFRVVKNMYTQTLEPRLFYVYIPYKDQTGLPLFDSGFADLNMSTLFTENQFSGNDRVNNANQISLALTSRLIDSKSGVQRLAATVGQRFYFTDQKVSLASNPQDRSQEIGPRTRNSSDIIGTVTARLLNNINVDFGLQYNTKIDRAIRSNIGARYNPEPGKVLNLSYRYTREDFGAEIAQEYRGLVGVNQIDLSAQWPLSPRWYSLGRINYSFLKNRNDNIQDESTGLVEGLAGIEYNAGCWQARAVAQRVQTATAEANYAFFFQLELGGIASIGNNPLALLSRSIPGYVSSAMLNNDLQRP